MSKLFEQINTAPRTVKKIGDLFPVKTGGTPSRLKPEYYSGGSIPWVKTQELIDSVIFDTSEKITPEAINNSNAKVFPAGSIILAMYGATVGKLGKLGIDASTNQACATFIPNNNADVDYLYFLLLKYRKNIISEATGSAQQNLSVDKIKNLEFTFPELPVQKKIAEILSAYDAKIENNNFIIKKLEATAQALFDEWFVNFRFPGHEKVKFIDSEIGEIPGGWNVGQVKDLIKVESGFPFSSNVFDKNGKYKLVTIRNVQDGEFVPDCDNGISELPEKLPDFCKLKTGDILLSLTGNVGRICLVIGNDYVLNQRVAKLVPIDENNKPFAYFLFRKKEFQNLLINMAKGSAQPNLSPVDTKNMEIIIPEKGILKNFNRVTLPFLTKIVELKEENISLKSQRDQLLAKLI